MHIQASFDVEFEILLNDLESKYGKEIFNLDGIGEQLDIVKFSNKFFTNKTTVADISIDGNANVADNGVIAYTNELVKPYERLNSYYQLWKRAKEEFGLETANEMIRANLVGDIYINDFHGLGAGKPYCFNYSTYDIMTKGLSTVDKIKSLPPKYLYAYKSQVEQFITIASNATLGATGLADLLIVMAFYVEDIMENGYRDAHFQFASEKDAWAYVKENIISMIYTLNQPMRGNQSPFTNVSIYDDEFLNNLVEDYIHPYKGTPVNIDIVKKLQLMFIDIMNEELERTPITFPVTTACFAINNDGEIIDKDFLNIIAERNLKFGFINMYLGKSSTLSSCCRLRSDMLNDYFNSFGAGSTKIGSLGVVTINYARLGFRFKDSPESYLEEVERLVTLGFKINYVKKLIVTKRIEEGYHALYTEGYLDINKQYLTSGVNGFNETIELMGYDPLSDEGVKFGTILLDKINEVNDKLGAEYRVPVNTEQIPAENVSIKLAQKDELLGYNKGEYVIYSNQFIPLTTKADMLDRIKLQGEYDKHFSGGSILHLNIEAQITDKSFIIDLLESCGKMGVVYVAINYNLQMCSNGHLSVGKGNKCNICGGDITDNYTRVVGFLTNTKNWHKVRREVDYPNREFY